MSDLWFIWFVAALLAGIGCGATGLALVSLQLPFMGVCLSHAALAGAVFAHGLGLPVMPTALAASLATAAIIGPLADRVRVHANTMMSIIFSVSLGAAFLGLALFRDRRSDILNVMWGNLLLVRRADLLPLALSAAAPLIILSGAERAAKAVLFDRELARVCGLPASLIYYALIAVSGAVITVDLNVVGGLMLFSLLTQPAAAALRWAKGYRAAVLGSAAGGAFAAVGGLALSLALDWPVGASIVLVSTVLYGGSLLARPPMREDEHS